MTRNGEIIIFFQNKGGKCKKHKIALQMYTDHYDNYELWRVQKCFRRQTMKGRIW